MKTFRPLFCAVVLLLGLPFLGKAVAETLQKDNGQTAPKPMVVRSKTLEVDDAQNIVTFTGEVNAEKDNFTIECQKMVVYYEKASSKEKKGDFATKVDRIVATGKVKINRAEGGTATAEKGEYFQDEDKLVLTGKPVVKQGNDFVEGDRITLFLKDNRSIVEGSENKKVKAIIFPKSKER